MAKQFVRETQAAVEVSHGSAELGMVEQFCPVNRSIPADDLCGLLGMKVQDGIPPLHHALKEVCFHDAFKTGLATIRFWFHGERA